MCGKEKGYGGRLRSKDSKTRRLLGSVATTGVAREKEMPCLAVNTKENSTKEGNNYKVKIIHELFK
jgi:hypothetical protein